MTMNDDDLERQLRKLGEIPVPDTLLRNVQIQLGHLTPEAAERVYLLGKTSRSSEEGKLQSNLEMAIAHFQNVLQFYTPEAYLQQHLSVLYDLGSTYCDLPEGDRLSNLETALTYFKHALYIVREYDPASAWTTIFEQVVGETYRTQLQELKHRAGVSKAIGDVTFLYRDLDAALNYYHQALDLYRMIESRLDEAIVLKAIGDAYHIRQQMTTALEHYQQAALLFGQIEDQYDEAMVLKAIGDIYQASNEPTVARTHYEQALDLFRQIEDRMAEATVLEAMGDKKEVKIALDLFQQVGETSMVHARQKEPALQSGHFAAPKFYLPETLPLVLDAAAPEGRTLPPATEPVEPVTPFKKEKAALHRVQWFGLSLEIPLLILIISGSLLAGALVVKKASAPSFSSGPCSKVANHLPLSQHGIGVVRTLMGGCIGISDGHATFDTTLPGRTDSELKDQAVDKLSSGDVSQAAQLWKAAIARDPADAEARIYLEDQNVLAVHRPYFSLVIGTILSPDYTTGRDDLQGAYLAQKAYNDQAIVAGKPLLRLLIAVAQSDTTSVDIVAHQVVQAAIWDQTIKGVVGWPTSSSAYSAINVLGASDSLVKLPLVSPTASSDALTGISPYFFRINPTNAFQEQQAARYVKEKLHATRVVVFVDPNDQYSSSLAHDFQVHFQDAGHHIVAFEQYTRTDVKSIERAMADVQARQPDMIFFSGYASDVGTVLGSLPGCHLQDLHCPLVLGGDALYLQGDYSLSSQARANIARLQFTSFTFPYASSVRARISDSLITFLQNFVHTYDPHQQYPENTYGHTIPEAHTMFSYDAIQVMLHASDMLYAKGHTDFSADDLRDMLAHIDATHQFQGLSWPIAFGSNGNDLNGQVIVLAKGASSISQVWPTVSLPANLYDPGVEKS